MSPEQRLAVVREAARWIGTPYHHHGRVHGVGVDCAMLLAEVFERAGVVPRVDITAADYAHDWHLHRGEELFRAWLRRAGAVPVAAPSLGAIALFRYGRAYSHGGIVVDLAPLAVVHAYLSRGVVRHTLDEEPLAGRPVEWWGLA